MVKVYVFIVNKFKSFGICRIWGSYPDISAISQLSHRRIPHYSGYHRARNHPIIEMITDCVACNAGMNWFILTIASAVAYAAAEIISIMCAASILSVRR